METKISQKKYIEGLGRRKRSSARVRLFKGDGKIMVNNLKLEDYFEFAGAYDLIMAPLKITNLENKFDISVYVKGGGKKAQAEAIRLGIARALLKSDPSLRATLRKEGFLTRDPREKERKKYGLKRARRAPQWSKR